MKSAEGNVVATQLQGPWLKPPKIIPLCGLVRLLSQESLIRNIRIMLK